eukprot:COSAG04_NODE_1353_length_7114_cov_121.711333_5_plen_62_part_00
MAHAGSLLEQMRAAAGGEDAGGSLAGQMRAAAAGGGLGAAAPAPARPLVERMHGLFSDGAA